VIFTMPDKMSEEKRSLLRAYGARVVVTPTNVPRVRLNITAGSRRDSQRRLEPFMPPVREHGEPNRHYQTTGLRYAQTGGKQTFSSVRWDWWDHQRTDASERERKGVRVVGVAQKGSIFYSRFHGVKEEPHQYHVEGIGEDFRPRPWI